MSTPWETLRSQMPVTQKWAYFDHAAVSPLPEPTRQVISDWGDHFAENGVVDWGDWNRRIEVVRELTAQRIGAATSEIALIRNTTEGISLIAEGFPWQAGDNVVVPDSEFPSNLYPWMNLSDRGVEVRQVACPDGVIDPKEIESACNERTRIVAVSWVGYACGWRADLAALADLAHQQGALLFVDAIQGLGVLPLDVSDVHVDFLAADGHKWMLGPEGAGVLYIREEHLERLRPLGVGWNSVQQAGSFADTRLNLKTSASRYEGGTHNMSGYLGLAASMQLTAEFSSDEIARRLKGVTDRCCDQLMSIGGHVVSVRSDKHWSGIIACEFEGHKSAALQRACLQKGVVVNTRNGRLRISPHLYTNESDIMRLRDTLRSVIAN
ncbi:MAG: aminotransferase class V-fold PLP-dependent enzyme [Planctomycetaceae bacterium]|nr:aminotransferase class V-fold PLP-dependent enzyme [Planctomycetaceae bacterium]